MASYRLKTLKKIEHQIQVTDDAIVSKGPSIAFKQRMLDPYLQMLESTASKHKISEEVIANKAR